MEYIAIYVLTMSYCLAPKGKTACERQKDVYEFATALHCVRVRNELVMLYDEYYGNVILYPEQSKCEAKAQLAVTTLDEDEALATGKRLLSAMVEIFPYK